MLGRRRTHHGIDGIRDRYPGEGPLGGSLTALHHSAAEWNRIVACDMPYLNPELLRGLLEEAELRNADCLMPKGQPLCAVYHRRCLPMIERELQKGVRKVRQALNDLHVGLYETAEVLCFQNMNRPEDWPMGLND